MARYNSFEDLPTWRVPRLGRHFTACSPSRLVANTIYKFSSVGSFAVGYGLRDQIRRAAVSIMSNGADEALKREDCPLQRSWPAVKRRAVAFGCTLGRIVRNGFDRESNKEFVKFLSIAKASVAEVRPQLFLALDSEYVAPENHSKLNEQLKKLEAEIAGFMRYLEQNHRPSDR